MVFEYIYSYNHNAIIITYDIHVGVEYGHMGARENPHPTPEVGVGRGVQL